MKLINWIKTLKYRRAEKKGKALDAKIQRESIKAYNGMIHGQGC